nr:MAG TPA: hypothetical protein [Caudoviricetes sp.]
MNNCNFSLLLIIPYIYIIKGAPPLVATHLKIN